MFHHVSVLESMKPDLHVRQPIASPPAFKPNWAAFERLGWRLVMFRQGHDCESISPNFKAPKNYMLRQVFGNRLARDPCWGS
jgi:hypothetical protein